MAIQAVSFGNNMQTPAAQAKPAKDRKPMGPIAKGAVIGTSVGAGFAGLGALGLKAIAKASGNTFSGFIKEAGGWGKYLGSLVKGLAGYAIVGAAIGGVVRLVKGKDEDDETVTPANNAAQQGQAVDANA